MRQGQPYRRPELGLYAISLGPRSPIPGERLQLVIYDTENRVVRRLEQVRGRCIDPGYIDYFLGPNCRPARYLMPLVDIAPGGVVTELFDDFTPDHPKSLYDEIVEAWVEQHGIPQGVPEEER